MKLNKIAQVLILGTAIVGLSACSSTKKPSDMNGANGVPGAQAYGMGGSDADLRNLQGPYSSTATAGQNESLYFDFNENIVKQMYLADLQIHASYLLAHPNASVKLEGNTDARGSREYNIALGWRRADAVAKVLELDGVTKRQIQEISYGSEKPFANGTTDQDYQLNRRVDLVYNK